MSLLFILLFQASAQVSTLSCDYYLQQEQMRNCGPHGYFMEFAYPYCQAFLVHQNEFSPVAQNWLKSVRVELMREVEKIPQDISCQKVEEMAFASHRPAYKKTNFCGLPLLAKLHILSYFNNLSLYLNPQFVTSALDTAASCLEE